MESFSYTVAHDLRAPLRAISGFSRILLEESSNRLDAEGIRYLNIIQSDIKKMGNLIDDLLTLSRLGRRQMRIIDLEMDELARSVSAALQEKEPQRNLQVLFSPMPPGRGDRDMLQLVLENLLGNALKFTPLGGAVRVTARRTDEGVRIAVSDTGPGIPGEHLTGIFERFRQVSTADSRRLQGTGLGLAIVKHIVHAHGGKIWAESEVGQGSTFIFVLPS